MSPRPRSIWTANVVDDPMLVLAAGFGILIGIAVGVGKLELTWYAMAAPLPVALSGAVALARNIPRAILAGMGGCCVCLCAAVPLAAMRAWGAMF